MEKTFINPAVTHNMPQFYSQAVAVAGAATRTVYISGQVAVDADGKLVGEDDLAAQSVQVFRNLKAVLDAAGAKPADVVKINAFVVGLDGKKSAVIGAEMLKLFPGPHQPASTWVGVASLLGRKYLLEVEAVAVLPA
jgi:enamine deaminase RidA (YjgF/YER057c/UK114 family)